jgi:hypothetical protein
MSDENLEIVRSIYAAWLQGESPRSLIDPEVEYVNPADAVEPGTRRGRKAFAGIRDVYDDVRVEPEELIDAGGDEVVVIARITGKGRGSGSRAIGGRDTSGGSETERAFASAGSTIRSSPRGRRAVKALNAAGLGRA